LKVFNKTVLYLENQGFIVYLWHEWVSQRGLSLQDTDIDLVAQKDGELYAVQCRNWDIEVSWRDLKPSHGEKNF